MPASMQNLTPDTPMGATLVAGGATFRVWAPGASEVHVVLQDFEDFEPGDTSLPTRDAQGRWAGFVAPVVEGQCYCQAPRRCHHCLPQGTCRRQHDLRTSSKWFHAPPVALGSSTCA